MLINTVCRLLLVRMQVLFHRHVQLAGHTVGSGWCRHAGVAGAHTP